VVINFGEDQMNISNLTLEERERLAYIEGNVELANLLGKLIDAEQELNAWEEYYD
jgi:hypothetical protein